MSIEHAKDIYRRLNHANGFYFLQDVKMRNDNSINAESTWGTIFINRGMLIAVRNDDEMALVLAHEIAHDRLGHKYSTPKNELEADKLGSIWVGKAGWNVCRGMQLIARFHAEKSESHPSSDSRMKAIGCYTYHQTS